MSSTHPKIVFKPRDRRDPKSIWLQEHRSNVKSQSGEDGLFEKIFSIIGEGGRFVVDFGAGDGERLSNSYNLCVNKKWSGVLIEPSAAYDKLAALYARRRDVETMRSAVGLTREDDLDAHLRRAKIPVPEVVDLLSIDIDGCDVHVLSDLRERRARVLCIEFNHFVPLDVHLVQPRNAALNIGTSLLATVEIARDLGYELIATTDMNAIFVDAPLFPKFDIEDNSVESMHFLGLRETKIAHSYDGTLYLCGLDGNPWKGFKIDHERIQVLPSNMRRWKFGGRIWPAAKL